MQRFDLSSEPTVGFATTPTPGGHTWSLPSVFGHLLHEAEARYGPRDRDYTILGIEFGEETPRIWFPGDRKDIVIQLGLSARLDLSRAVFQLAHETIHVLAPVTPPAKVIEEGLVVVFSDEVGLLQMTPIYTGEANYQKAGGHVANLLALDPTAIKKIRANVPCFSHWTPALITGVIPAADLGLVNALCETFFY